MELHKTPRRTAAADSPVGRRDEILSEESDCHASPDKLVSNGAYINLSRRKRAK
jgi:hypothetical protein